MLGLGSSIVKGGAGARTIVTDNLILKHNYDSGSVHQVSTGAALFNGTSDYIAIGAKPVDTADATYCWWANSSSTASNHGVFSHGGVNTGAFDMNHSATNKPLLYLNNSLYQYWVDNPAQDDGEWHHWALVVDISNMAACKLYIDGVEITQDSRATSDAPNSYGNLEIGRSSTINEWEGYMCNFGVWSRHLSQAEIKSIWYKNYADLTSGETADLVSWWNLDEETNTSGGAGTGGVKDHHGSNHGTLS